VKFVPDNLTIRQAAYADKPALAAFLAAAYGGRDQYKFPRRWEWAFQRNPFLAGDAPPVWIAVTEDGRIAGQSAALVEPLVIGGREVRAGWGVDFHVLPEYRGQGIGTKLQAANNAAHEVFMSLSMTAGAAGIKSSIGMQTLPPVPVFTRILQHDPASVRATLAKRFPPAQFLAAPLARLLTRREARALRGYAPPREPRVEPVDAFSGGFDSLWARVSPKFSALIRRDSQYLTWKFRQQPHMTHEIFAARRAGALCGYVTLRRARPPERNAGIICDLFADPEDAAPLGALLWRAVQFFREAGVTYITAASSVPAYQAALRALGFKHTKSAAPMIRADVDVPQSGWLLGKGDHDWDQYPLA
jgi:hypothetical protein